MGIIGQVAEVEFLETVPAIHATLVLTREKAVQFVVVGSASAHTMHCVLLTPGASVRRGDSVVETGEVLSIPVGVGVLGRAFDIFGHGHDGQGKVSGEGRRALYQPISVAASDIVGPGEIMETGIKAIDFFAPVRERGTAAMIGGAGIGKTVILTELINRFVIQVEATADRLAVFAAVGERSREAQELYDNMVDGKVLPYTSLVLGQMGENPAVRFHTAYAGVALAEYFRDEMARDVLFFMDNIFRFGQAGLELATVMNTIPSEGGYQPNLASQMADVLQRLVSTKQRSITSFLALFVPSDDMTDAGVRVVFPYLDTLVVLSREVFAAGRFPAMDLLASTSTALTQATAGEAHYTTYLETRQLLEQTARLARIVSLVGASELSQANQAAYQRAQLITAYMTQDLFVSEAELGHKAEFVPRAETVATVRDILDGKYDELEPERLLYIGSIRKLSVRQKSLRGSGGSRPGRGQSQAGGGFDRRRG